MMNVSRETDQPDWGNMPARVCVNSACLCRTRGADAGGGRTR